MSGVGRCLRAGVLSAALLLALSGCSGDPEGMTARGSLAELRETGATILEAAAEGGELVEQPTRDVPCGGLGGNEWSKITYSYEAAHGLAKDPDESLGSAIAAMEALGIESDPVSVGPTGPEVSFHGEGFDGGLVVRENGLIEVRAQTTCLDNPDR